MKSGTPSPSTSAVVAPWSSENVTPPAFFVEKSGLGPWEYARVEVAPSGRVVLYTGLSSVGQVIMTSLGGPKNEWAVVLADAKGTGQIIIHQFDNSHGAASWRVSHPHPVFSADGKRIYFNVSSGPWTQLYVAERR